MDALLHLVYASQRPPPAWNCPAALRLRDYLKAPAGLDRLKAPHIQRHSKAFECGLASTLALIVQRATEPGGVSLDDRARIVTTIVDCVRQLAMEPVSLVGIAGARELWMQLIRAVDFFCKQQLPQLSLECTAVLAAIACKNSTALHLVIEANGIPTLVAHMQLLASCTGRHAKQRLNRALQLLDSATNSAPRCKRLVEAAGGMCELKKSCHEASQWPSDIDCPVQLPRADAFARMVNALGVGRAIYSRCTGCCSEQPTDSSTTSSRGGSAAPSSSCGTSPGHGLSLIFGLLQSKPSNSQLAARCGSVIKHHCETTELPLRELAEMLVVHCDTQFPSACTAALGGIEVLLVARVGAESYSWMEQLLTPPMVRITQQADPLLPQLLAIKESATKILDFFKSWQPDWAAVALLEAAAARVEAGEPLEQQPLTGCDESRSTVGTASVLRGQEGVARAQSADGDGGANDGTEVALLKSRQIESGSQIADRRSTGGSRGTAEGEPQGNSRRHSAALSATSCHHLAADPQDSACAVHVDTRRVVEDFATEAKAKFRALDCNGDGELDEFELSNGLADLGVTDDEISLLLFELDSDGDGQVSETEFVAGYEKFRRATATLT